MKTLLWILSMMSVSISAAFAQKIKDADVPEVVKNSFTKSFPGQKAKWEKEKENYEAGFKSGGRNMSATFQPDGHFLESETDIKESDLPPDALSYIKDHYKNKKIKESAKITSSAGVVTYEAELDGKDIIFDSKGKLLNTAL